MAPKAKTLSSPAGGWPRECVEWAGKLEADGYARVRQNYTRIPVHRLSYQTFNGPIPEGHVVRHKCDNRACWNPTHLETGTEADNSADMVARNRQARGGKNGTAKLTEDQVREIKAALLATPRGIGRALAKQYGVTATQISYIKLGQTWGHVT